MNSAQRRYYGNNRLLMSLVGVWPYQSKTSSGIVLLVYFIVAGSQLYCKVAFLVLAWPDIDFIMQSASPIIVDAMSATKLFNCLINSKKMRTILEKIFRKTDSSLNSIEIEIMRSYANHGKTFTLLWASYVFGTLTIYMGMSLLPQILGTLGNDTRELPSPVYYPIDIQEYYYPIFVHAFVTAFLFCASLVAADTMFAVCIEHACGMFSVLGYRLRTAVKDEEDHSYNVTLRKSDDEPYNNFTDCINRHNETIEFSELIESAHATSFLFTVGFNMLIISFTGIQIMKHVGEVHLMMGQLTVVFCQMSHLYIENYYGQRLLDHSNSVYTNIMNSKWYQTSLRTKKLLCTFITRSLEPCVLTTGGLYVMSMENFSWVLRTSMSYFTLLRTVQ